MIDTISVSVSAMLMTRFDKQFRARFWNKVLRSSKCWLWQAGTTKAGYGQLQARKVQSTPMLAHRVSWEMRHNKEPPGHVLHKCDTPGCVRPGHLFIGTQRANNLDRDRKGRTASGDRNGARTKPGRNPFVRNGGSGLCGEKHPMAKLTDKQVAQLQREFRQGDKRSDLAERYGVSVTHVYRLGRKG